jgi:hypothetical protein
VKELKPGQKWANDVTVANHCGVTTMTIYNWDNDPTLGFPAPSIINGKKLRNIDDIDVWLRERTVRRLHRKNETAEATATQNAAQQEAC